MMSSKEFNRDYIAKVYDGVYCGLVGYSTLLEFLGDRAENVLSNLAIKTQTSIKVQKWRFKPFHGKTVVFYLRP